MQRLDDQRYLTVHSRWDTAPSWHPCARAGADSEEGAVRFAAAPSLVAGIRAAAGARLQVSVRRGDFSDSGPLVVSDPGAVHASAPSDLAIDSPFEDPTALPVPSGNSAWSDNPEPGQSAALPQAPVAAGTEASDLTWTSAPLPEAALPLEPTMRSAPVEPQTVRPRTGTLRWLSLLIVVLVVLATLGLGIRALVWKSAPDSEPAKPAPSPAPMSRVPEPPQPAATSKPPLPSEHIPTREIPKAPDRTPTSDSGPSGKALYLELKGKNLSPQDLFDRGEQADRTGDCEAAIRLLIDAAKRAPGLAERLARRYDPEGFEPTPCFPQAKPDSAIVWYQNAAEQDIPAAQRRYGELLLGEATSGPIYQDAVDWLRKAASAGDEAAARRLDALGER